ncbi:response regulator [Planobispora takensis]|uniref:DNA-binding response regulator n=1 Tax=Planobispora takensis TaxID=1367882 RepID=A0A8J3SY44_9ACTN|nr:response regulator transcription factor [Planobispora takensis]GII02789.1 DNA-binding response regulator [Planobispora takensis]
MSQPTTVGIVDDHALFREGLREILEACDGLKVVGEAGDSGEALALVERERPDVLMLDVEIPGDDVLDTVGRVRVISPATKIIVLSMYDGPQLLRRLLSSGIRGYLLKSVHREEVISAIRSVVSDPERLVLAVSRDSLAQVHAPTPNTLTDKERQVLEFAAQALSNQQIATRLGLTEATVKRHLRNVFVKLGAVSRIDAVNRAIAASLISVPRDSGSMPKGFG